MSKEIDSAVETLHKIIADNAGHMMGPLEARALLAEYKARATRLETAMATTDASKRLAAERLIEVKSLEAQVRNVRMHLDAMHGQMVRLVEKVNGASPPLEVTLG